MTRPLPSPSRAPGALRPPDKTLADYLAIGIGPVLIMLLVGSLIFFLVEIGYRGAFSEHIYWTLFWFTVAAVLVSRISIEQGSHYGALYGLALGAATGLRLCQFLGAPLSALVLLGLVWWCASKLTWDCTLIDEKADASGQGLLQFAGFEAGENPPAHGPPATPAVRPHAPGLWLIYFSLAALPVFGIGQWLIPLDDPAARLRGFLLCAVFVTSSLALLLTTSFLGLRRYLRQRQLLMPAPMARSWMILGGSLVVLVVLGALLLPRPRGLAPLAHLGLGLRERPQNASPFAWLRGEAARGEGRRIGTSKDARPDASPDGERARPGQTGASGDTPQPGGDEGRTQNGGARQDGQDQGGSPTENQPAPPPDSVPSPSLPTGAPALLRWLSWALGLALLAFLLYRFGRRWLDALRRAWPARPGPAGPKAAAGPRRPAFADFPDPFLHRHADSMSPEQLTVYTFDALQAWAADAGRARRAEQTPAEFADQLTRQSIGFPDEITATARLYLRVTYGGQSLPTDSRDILRRFWSAIRPAR